MLIGCKMVHKRCKRGAAMFTRQREKSAEAHIIALVELDLQKKRVRLVLAREAIRERVQELEYLETIATTGRTSRAHRIT